MFLNNQGHDSHHLVQTQKNTCHAHCSKKEKKVEKGKKERKKPPSRTPIRRLRKKSGHPGGLRVQKKQSAKVREKKKKDKRNKKWK